VTEEAILLPMEEEVETVAEATVVVAEVEGTVVEEAEDTAVEVAADVMEAAVPESTSVDFMEILSPILGWRGSFSREMMFRLRELILTNMMISPLRPLEMIFLRPLMFIRLRPLDRS
jgi:hypothetical protein